MKVEITPSVGDVQFACIVRLYVKWWLIRSQILDTPICVVLVNSGLVKFCANCLYTRYSAISRKDIKIHCPVCRGLCNCKKCALVKTKGSVCKVSFLLYFVRLCAIWQCHFIVVFIFWCLYILDLQESPGGEGKILSIKISNHQFYKLLPVKLDQEQLDELELEAKVQGLFMFFSPPNRTSVVLVWPNCLLLFRDKNIWCPSPGCWKWPEWVTILVSSNLLCFYLCM